MFAAFKEICWRNRNKLIAGIAVIGVGTILYNMTFSETALKSPANNHDDEEKKIENKKLSLTRRHQLLNRVRKQSNPSIKHFFLNLGSRLSDVVDVSRLIRNLKEIRKSSPIENSVVTQNQLWEEIKVEAFSMLFVTTYVSCTAIVLLQIQLHILTAQAITLLCLHNNDSFLQLQDGERKSYNELNEMIDNFPQIIVANFDYILHSGLESITQHVRSQVALYLSVWKVEEKLSVDFSELIQMIVRLRRSIEFDGLDDLVRRLILNEENGAEETVGVLGKQTWDVAESPMFRVALAEALDVCFEAISADLRQSVFGSMNNGGHVSLRAPPLASLLPQLKAVATRIIDVQESSQGAMVNGFQAEKVTIWREISEGATLDELCVHIFDSLLRQETREYVSL